jgi:hypothetical protein
VLAHSLGTLLLGKALLQNPRLRLGRVILTGCILPPDFPWTSLISEGRVNAVLNHRGTRDFWARIARFVIPDSGPTGRQGALDAAVVDVPAEDFSHSQFFLDDKLPACYRNVWEPFWTGAPGSDRERWPARPEVPWSRRWWRWREPQLRSLFVLILTGLTVLLVAALVLGLPQAIRWLTPD